MTHKPTENDRGRKAREAFNKMPLATRKALREALKRSKDKGFKKESEVAAKMIQTLAPIAKKNEAKKRQETNRTLGTKTL